MASPSLSESTPSAPAGAPIPSKWAATRLQVRRVWALSKPYFYSEQKWQARGLLASIVILNLSLVYMSVLFNDWNKLFYDSLQDKNAAVFWEQLGRFTYLAFAFIVIAVYKFYLSQLLEMRWRAWMTSNYLQRWLSNQAFYRFELARYATGAQDANANANANTMAPLAPPDNPDQRIQSDINQFTGATLSLSMGLLNSVVTLVSFVGILWALSGAFSFSFQGSEYVVPGFMVWMAVLYCVVGSFLTHYIGRPQIALNFQQEKVEADFRHRLVRVREYSESIALDRGEKVEQAQLELRFGRVLANYLALIRAQKRLIWFTSFFGQAATVFPFVVAAPRFFSGAIQLGELMQISSAFGQVQGALSWFVDSYSSLASWRATTDRLTSFDTSMQSAATGAVLQVAPDDTAVQATGLGVALPTGAVLLAQTELKAQAGDTVLLTGPSGSGKSTLFRALAGIWPFASGTVARGADSMFLPQRPYLPDGPLRDALAYPEAAGTYPDAALQQALSDALLPHLSDQLDRSESWGQKLSGGEQQRLAIARVLLKKPRWVFADEATSALDATAEATVYTRLLDVVKAQNGALVSIAHHQGVARFHQRNWQLQAQEAGAAALFKLSEKPL